MYEKEVQIIKDAGGPYPVVMVISFVEELKEIKKPDKKGVYSVKLRFTKDTYSKLSAISVEKGKELYEDGQWEKYKLRQWARPVAAYSSRPIPLYSLGGSPLEYNEFKKFFKNQKLHPRIDLKGILLTSILHIMPFYKENIRGVALAVNSLHCLPQEEADAFFEANDGNPRVEEPQPIKKKVYANPWRNIERVPTEERKNLLEVQGEIINPKRTEDYE